MTKLLPGYYWLRDGPREIIAEFSGTNWLFIGSDEEVDDKETYRGRRIMDGYEVLGPVAPYVGGPE
jgi:hypothetical protein